jgi:hypothetical protein
MELVDINQKSMFTSAKRLEHTALFPNKEQMLYFDVHSSNIDLTMIHQISVYVM